MAPRLFITGGSGFVGSRLINDCLRRGYRISALDRSDSLRRRFAGSRQLQVVRGDVLDPRSYRDALSGADMVVHLAAATGRATPADHVRVNADGTRTLLEACRTLGVRKFMFVSSVATTFSDLRRYPYGRAKALAEEAIARSGLQFLIIRPTLIFGPGSVTLRAFQQLTRLPLTPVFGNGRTRVQPIHVDDVVGAISCAIEGDWLMNGTIEVGGPEAVTIDDLLREVGRSVGRQHIRLVHIPLGLIALPLRIAETLGLGRFLPFSEGQLSTFRFDGLAAPSALAQSLRPGRTLSEMVQATEDRTDECRLFVRCLIGVPPDPYVIEKYAEAHKRTDVFEPANRFDAFLVWLARRHTVLTRIADAYSRVFLPTSVLRKKLVLVLAILETSAFSHRLIDRVTPGTTRLLPIRFALRAAVALVFLCAGILLLSPARLAMAVSHRRDE